MWQRFFSPRVNFQCGLSYGVRTSPCAIAYINICLHVKDPVVHIRVRWIMETLKHSACTVGWVARICRSWLSPRKPTRISHGINPIETIQLLKKEKRRKSLTLSTTTSLDIFAILKLVVSILGKQPTDCQLIVGTSSQLHVDVTPKKYFPRQIYSGVKLAYADFTPPTPGRLQIITRKLLPRDFYSP